MPSGGSTPPLRARGRPARRRGKASRRARWYSSRRLPDAVLLTAALLRLQSGQGGRPHCEAWNRDHLVPRFEVQRPDEPPNLPMTPHVSGRTDGMLDVRAKLIAENIRRIVRALSPAAKPI